LIEEETMQTTTGLRNIIAGMVLAALAGTSFAQSGPRAEAFPNKPIRILVGVAPGGGTDFVARLIGQKLSETWGHPVVVDNRTGATGLIAMGILAKSPPDGYTHIVFNMGHLMSASLAKNPGFDPMKDFAPLSLIANGGLLLVAHPSVPGKNLKEFIDYAKAHPGKLAFASGGQASIPHLAMELLKREARIDLLHVPYKGTGPGVLDLLGGQVQLYLTNVLALHTHMKAGRLKGYAVAGAKRISLVPDIPTFAELGLPKVDVSLWQGIMGPAGMPQAIQQKISRAVVEGVRSADAASRLEAQGAEPAGTTPREFAAFLKSERTRWLALATEAKIAPK
jgi:tripartite-type tricarboxylate transporter receptor subunit TctC